MLCRGMIGAGLFLLWLAMMQAIADELDDRRRLRRLRDDREIRLDARRREDE